MLAEARVPDPFTPGKPWKPPTAGKDIKDPGSHEMQRVGRYQRQEFSQSSSALGLEMKPELVWEDWDLGREFTKTLVLKNVHIRLQKLHVRPPVSKFFSTLVPHTIVISPGTSFSVPISFRPLKRCEYEDSIDFESKDGSSFQVCLRATIPCCALEVPDSVLLPLCAVRNTTYTAFLLKNVSKLQTWFELDCTEPFQLSPEQGVLKPGQECNIMVEFQPQEALVYQQQLDCRFGEEGDEGDKAESCCNVLLQGLAKFPFLQLKSPGTKGEKEQYHPELHFGSVAVGKSLQKHVDIFNPSPVTARFSLLCLSNGLPLQRSEFSCDVSQGEVASGGSLRATVTYTPAVVDRVSVDYLSLKYRVLENVTQLKMTGSCLGPNVSLSSSVVDFGCVEEGGAAVQTLELLNSSHVEALFQWDLDCSGNSVFSFQPASGAVRPHSRTTLRAVYRPRQTIAHHRRVACLILHREPLFLDLIGTCHSELHQPAVLKPEHLVLYKLHWYRRHDPADTPSAMLQNQDASMDHQELLSPAVESLQKPDSAGVVSRDPMQEYYQSCLGCMDPLPSSSTASPPHVSVMPRELLFTHTTSFSVSTSSKSSQFVSITNHTRGKLGLVWTAGEDSPFSVSPSSCDLPPLKSTSFRVTYDPKQLSTLHGAQLECFAYYKDNPPLEERLLCPPWCVTVRVIGHSFQPGKEHFIPNCSLTPCQVAFPTLSVLSYRTVLLQNCGDLPLTFCLDPSSNPALSEYVSVVPTCGFIPPGNHQILTLRTTPTEESPKMRLSWPIQLNAANHTEDLNVVLWVDKVSVSLKEGSSLYFQPTAVGSRIQRTVDIRNLSSLPLRFQWSIPEPDQELISVEPDAGELHPNEKSVQTWSFSPLEEKTYTLKPTFTFWSMQTTGCNKSQLTLVVVGTGSKGFIEAEKAVLDVGEALVGSYRSIQVPLVNNSPCTVSFCLSVQQTLLDEELSYDPETEPIALKLDCAMGTIASRSKMLLRSTVRPNRRAQYLWTISYQTLNASGLASSPLQAVCEVRAKGVFPTLRVIDVHSGGSVGRLSKGHLWKLFSLDRLNELMLSNPCPAELTHRTPIRHSVSSSPSIFTNAMLDFNFSATPLNSEPSVFGLMFHNPGSIPVDWAFLFPEDQQIELEYWAETGEFSSTEMYQMKVQNNKLFSITPRSGTLLPGQQRVVSFTYSHLFAGMDRFPVVFKLSYGREILVNFQGVTVERDRPFLHFASKRHVFTSVTIGDCTPPKQVYKIHNRGAVPVHYTLDTAVLLQLQEDNFNHPVLCCLNPEGQVRPGETAMLGWIFSPLEAKMWNIPIHVEDGDSTLVKFEGCGLDSPTLISKIPSHCNDMKASEPCVQRGPFPGQVVFLSEDSVSLGDIPVCSQSSKILFLTNVSHTDTVHYTWELQSNKQAVEIHPERGTLCPGESAPCVLTFTSTDYPAVYQLDIICQVFQEAALTRYYDALQHLEEEKKRQRDEFTVTDKIIKGSYGVLIDKEPVAAPVRKGPPLRKYKTLPPICASAACETVGAICTKITRAEKRAQREKGNVWRCPEPPLPALLHLGVTARSHGLLEYCAHFPDQSSDFRCLQSVNPRQPESTSLHAGQGSQRKGPDRDVTMRILASLLRGILDEPPFSQSLITQLLSSGTQGEEDQLSPVDGEGTPHPEHVPADVSEEVLLNTLQNLIMEAVGGELVLTAHPRTVMLPPVSTRARRTPNAVAEEEKEDFIK
ncbi:hypothetical protein JOQ06_030032 [Pogonophryne albipinna]|uniref:Cilia- and flagella-associated protein 65 n=1 Tax=Pogonophryne albipinna TaxID=1090488 RepID=A0AAD6AYA9_9TELE|nr:hypothetical protein JOQ06_030032 [Pogonophryne albipinna]